MPHRRFFRAASIALVLAFLQGSAPAESARAEVRSPLPAAKPLRLVSLVPSMTEIAFAVGAGDLLTAVDEHSDFPPEAARLPRVGGLRSLSLEAIAALRPTHLLVVDGFHAQEYARFEKLGAQTVSCPFSTVADVRACILRIGGLTGNAARAGQVAAHVRAAEEAAQARAGGKPKPTVLMLVSADPLFGVGNASFTGDILRLAGAENVLAATGQAYPLISAESIVATDPDLIFVFGEADRRRFLGNRVFRHLRAVREHRVHVLDEDLYGRPGPRVAEALEQLGRLLHALPRDE